MTTHTIKTAKKRDLSYLKPYQFKPGNKASPGRPKAILSKRERLELLSEMARMNKNKANPVEAIREQNKMEHVYEEGLPAYHDNRTINIIVSDGKTKELLQGINKRLLSDGDRAKAEIDSTKEVENATDKG